MPEKKKDIALEQYTSPLVREAEKKKEEEKREQLRKEAEERRGGEDAMTLYLQAREKATKKGMEAGMSEKAARAAAEKEIESGKYLLEEPGIRKAKEEELEKTFEERGVFKEIEQERIIPEEQENLRVMVRIAKSLIPESISKTYKAVDTVGGLLDFEKALKKGEPISQAEITTIENDLKNAVEAETSAEIDARIEDTEEILIQNGISVAGVTAIVGGVGLAGVIREPVSEFVGTDGQIRSLEIALSQYNEVMTIPARSVDSAGLDPMIAFDKYDRIEEDILALEQQLKLSAQTSTKVALALRGRAIEARILKLKEKLQEGRGRVAASMAAETFGEKEIPESVAFLRRLQNERTQKED